MSGTSVDGVDAATLYTDGDRILAFGASHYRPYSPAERATIFAAMGRWPGDPGVGDAEHVVEAAHLESVNRLARADLVGFHGQTLAHDPASSRTHQAGCGDRLATALECPVVWNFRSADMARGGQGAPLAPFYHFALAKFLNLAAPIAFLNIGGVANVTWVDPTCRQPEDQGALLAFDSGPGNCLIDDLMRQRRTLGHDAGGQLAAAGTPDQAIIEEFLAQSFLDQPPPKSIDRDLFKPWLNRVDRLPDPDAAATLTAMTSTSIAKALNRLPTAPARVMVAGGGRHNQAIMNDLARQVPCPVDAVETSGLDGDMLEAQAFAFLAMRCLRTLPISCPSTTGCRRIGPAGRISKPS